MFQVGRYDPESKKRKQSSNGDGATKRTSKQHHSPKKQVTSSLRVIARDERAPVTAATRLPQEALDDLELVDVVELDLNDTAVEELVSVAPLSTTEVAAGQVTQTEIETAFRIAAMPLDQAASGWKLAPFLVENLRNSGFTNFFPVQALVIPDVIASERHAHVQAPDVCIAAPTGSGKTLAYVLPLLNSLATKSGGLHYRHRLQALVVLPSRDLATQVCRVFESYAMGSTLKIGLAIGQSDFVAEQKALTVDETSTQRDMLEHRLSYDPGDLRLALQAFRGTLFPPASAPSISSRKHIPADGWSNVDILVCTPGRLVDHLDNTVGFTLQHIRFLVIDEADRLLNQTYHNWIGRVMEASKEASVRAWRNSVVDGKLRPLALTSDGGSVLLEPITWRRGGSIGDDSDRCQATDSVTAAMICEQVQLRKILVSATLTRDPQKLAALHLVNPKHFNVHQLRGETNKYSMPAALQEFTLECAAEQKPLILLAILLEQLEAKGEKTTSVVFTANLDSTHRLARLLQLLWGALHHSTNAVGEFSSALNQQDRAVLMSRCNDPNDSLSVIVCSDGMSRGMDIESVDTVINYDVPTLAKIYVHRCGRTARASRTGQAISLLKSGQVSLFFRMRRLIQGSERVQTMPVKKNILRDAVHVYKSCVQALRDVLDAEENGELSHTDDVTEYIPDVES